MIKTTLFAHKTLMFPHYLYSFKIPSYKMIYILLILSCKVIINVLVFFNPDNSYLFRVYLKHLLTISSRKILFGGFKNVFI